VGNKEITHPKDIEYFKEFPSPLMELIHSAHFTNINSTITFFGPLLYFFARAIEAHKILEIGHAECYTGWYLANAVKDNGIRYQVTNGQYYGIDIAQSELAKERLTGLPATILNLDSAKLTQDTFKDITFDLIFQDGAHDTEHVLYELETLYPQLKGEGQGYFIMHDIFGPSEEAYHKVLKMNYNFQHCAIWSSAYGLGIFRKMDGYDYEKRYWRD
jgi:predicted O-methyltransferase YrrM